MIGSTRASEISVASAALSLLACLVAFGAAMLPARGHPPLADYVGAIAVPAAWIVAGVGLGSAVASRRRVGRARYRVAAGGNIAALLAGGLLWYLWPVLRAM